MALEVKPGTDNTPDRAATQYHTWQTHVQRLNTPEIDFKIKPSYSAKKT